MPSIKITLTKEEKESLANLVIALEDAEVSKAVGSGWVARVSERFIGVLESRGAFDHLKDPAPEPEPEPETRSLTRDERFDLLQETIDGLDEGDGAPRGAVLETAAEECQTPTSDLDNELDKLFRMGDVYEPYHGHLRTT